MDRQWRTSTEAVQRRMALVVNFFVFLKLLFFCFVVAICDLMHDVEAIPDNMLNAYNIWKSFLKYE